MQAADASLRCRRKVNVVLDQRADETEQLLMIKTTAQAFEDVKRTIKELHSYELPEVLALPVSDGEESALAWIGSSVRHGRDNP